MGIEENKKFDRVWKIVGIVFVVGCVLLVGFVIHGCVSGNRDDNWKRLYKKEYVSEDGKFEYRVGVNKDDSGKVINYYAIITDVLKFDNPEATEFTFPSEVDGYVVEQLGYAYYPIIIVSSQATAYLSDNDIIETVYVPKTVNRVIYSNNISAWFFTKWSEKTIVFFSDEINLSMIQIGLQIDKADIVISDKAMERYKKEQGLPDDHIVKAFISYSDWIPKQE